MNLDDLYNEIILRYSRSLKHRRPLDNPDAVMHGVNPSCGDDIYVSIKLDGDKIDKISLTGTGCAISMASAEIMSDLMEGKTTDEAKKLIETFVGMIKKSITDEKLLEPLEDALAFENISNMPARVKCAVLAWHTLDEALNKILDN